MATVLIVDDRPESRQVLVTLLGDRGYRLLEAAGGAEALEQARAERPDLVVTDILMPKMDGYEFVRQLRADPDLAQIAVIFYTATYNGPQADTLAKSLGVRAVLRKPSDPETILLAVSEALRLHPPELVPGDASLGSATQVGAKLGRYLVDLTALKLTIDDDANRPDGTNERESTAERSKRLSENVTYLHRVVSHLAVLIEISMEMTSERNPARLVELAFVAACEIIESDYAAIGMLEGEGQGLRHLFTKGVPAGIFAGDARGGIFDSILNGRRLIRWRGGAAQAMQPELPQGHPRVRNFLGAPILLKGQAQGWIYFAGKRGGQEFNEEDEHLLDILVKKLTLHYENSIMYSSAQEHARELQVEAVKLRQAEGKLRLSEERLSGLVRSATDAIITIDDAQNIFLFNRAAEKIFGRRADDVIGAPLSRLMPMRFQAGHDSHVSRFGETGVSEREMGRQRPIFGMRPNGDEFPIEASISHSLHDGRRFYTVILRDITLRVKAEQELAESNRQLRELSANIQTIRETEKNRIARELHDDLGQQLTALKMDLSELESMLDEKPSQLGGKFATINALVDTTVTSLRRISADLRPVMLDDLGLVAAIEWLTEDFSRRYGIEMKLDIDDAEIDFESSAATAVFRMIQEALTNVARHANATRVSVEIRQEGGKLMLEIRDNGVGITAQDQKKGKSFGLIGMKERAQLLGGEITLTGRSGTGTVILIAVPLSQPSGGE